MYPHISLMWRLAGLGLCLAWFLGLVCGRTLVGLSYVKECGTELCTNYTYCSDNTCRDCFNVCLPPNSGKMDDEQTGPNNYDRVVCETQCQDYIHDIVRHYVTYAESSQMQKELRIEMQETIEGLRAMVAFSLTLSLLVGVGLTAGIGFACLKYRRIRQTNRREEEMMEKKISTVSGLVNNNKSGGGGGGAALRLEMPPQTGPPPSVATTTTPISTRHPSEDATLEYAYDNPGMTPSPILEEKTRGETSF